MESKTNEDSKNRHHFNFKKVKSNRGEDAYIQDNEYYFLFEREMKDDANYSNINIIEKIQNVPLIRKSKIIQLLKKYHSSFIIIHLNKKNVQKSLLRLI